MLAPARFGRDCAGYRERTRGRATVPPAIIAGQSPPGRSPALRLLWRGWRAASLLSDSYAAAAAAGWRAASLLSDSYAAAAAAGEQQTQTRSRYGLKGRPRRWRRPTRRSEIRPLPRPGGPGRPGLLCRISEWIGGIIGPCAGPVAVAWSAD